MRILITGGAGFIGRTLARALVEEGHRVTVLDALDPQVHGRGAAPDLPASRLRFLRGDVRDGHAVREALAGVEVVFHFAAAVGVGQSQYQIGHYVDANLGGTGVLLDVMANRPHRVRKIIVAGSMSSYGEGAYRCVKCGRVRPPLRRAGAVSKRVWDPKCPDCGRALTPLPTRESDRFVCNSIYAVTKMAQEELVLNYGAAYGVPAVALRFFNVYGPGQSLSNPYTGVASIFISRAKSGNPPVIYEDGLQTRDFVSVHDIVQACRLAMKKPAADGRSFNVGTGRPTTVLEMAHRIVRGLGAGVEPVVLRKFRRGDVRHCTADISEIRRRLGYEPRVTLEEGLAELLAWGRGAKSKDRFDAAQRELKRRRLV